MALPLDEGLAHLELGQHVGLAPRTRLAHLEAARRIFVRLEIPHERALAETALAGASA